MTSLCFLRSSSQNIKKQRTIIHPCFDDSRCNRDGFFDLGTIKHLHFKIITFHSRKNTASKNSLSYKKRGNYKNLIYIC